MTKPDTTAESYSLAAGSYQFYSYTPKPLPPKPKAINFEKQDLGGTGSTSNPFSDGATISAGGAT